MGSRMKNSALNLLAITCMFLGALTYVQAQTGNIDDTNKWAWGTNIGWINFKPTEGGVTVYLDHLEGFAYAESIGWIRLGTHTGGYPHTYDNTTKDNYGVNRHESGYLYGYAWSSTTGWINFNPTNGGVTINDETCTLDGYAYGENIGWIHFKNTGNNAYNVAYVNSPAVLADIENSDLEYTEGDGTKEITTTINVTDEDDINIENAVVQITANYIDGEDVLEFSDTQEITGNWDSAVGKMTLTGAASLNDYQTALRSVKYKNSLDNPTPLIQSGDEPSKARSVTATPRTVSFTINDGNDDSNTQNRIIIIIPVNDDPVVSKITGITLDEAAASTIKSTELQCSDPDQTTYFIYTITQAPANGQLKKDGTEFGLNGTFTQDELNADKITYTHDGSETTADNFKFEAADNNNATTPETTFDITITPVNDAPVLADIETVPLSYTENSGGVSITSSLNVSDEDNTNIESAVIEITGNYQDGEDVLNFTDANGITSVWNAGSGTLALTGSSSVANYQTALQNVKYENLLDNPTFDVEVGEEKKRIKPVTSTPRTVSYTIADGDLNSNTVTRDIEINPVNDKPVVEKNKGASLDEGGSVTIIGSMLKCSDPDGTTYFVYTVLETPEHGQLLNDGTRVALHGTFRQSDIYARNIIYQHDDSETTSDSFKFEVADNHNSTAPAENFNFIINPVDDPPQQPTHVTYTYNNDGDIVITWYDNSGNEIGFRIWRQRNSSAKLNEVNEFELVATVQADTEEYVDETAEEGVNYTYQVTSFNDDGESEVAQGEEGGETQVPAPLKTPTDLHASDAGNLSILLEWMDNSSLETGYLIERRTGISWEEIYTTPADAINYTDENVEEGTTYHYRIKAVRPDNESVFSSECSASCTLTGIDERTNGTPVEFTLKQNYPNPFNPSTTIPYGLPEGSHVKIVVYNLLGEEVDVLINQFQSAGYHDATFETDNLNSGIYLYKLEAGSYSEIKKMIFLK